MTTTRRMFCTVLAIVAYFTPTTVLAGPKQSGIVLDVHGSAARSGYALAIVSGARDSLPHRMAIEHEVQLSRAGLGLEPSGPLRPALLVYWSAQDEIRSPSGQRAWRGRDGFVLARSGVMGQVQALVDNGVKIHQQRDAYRLLLRFRWPWTVRLAVTFH